MAALAEEKVDVSQAANRKITSIAQDIIYVTLLDRFGHGISQSQLAEWDAVLARQQTERQQQKQHTYQGAFVPSNISSTSTIVIYWDNNDLLEGTSSGLTTSHFTNGIVVQREVHTAELPPGQPHLGHQQHARSARPRSVKPSED